MKKILNPILIFFVRIYQAVISPPLHFICGPMSGCRFYPSCSQYYIDAVTVNGPIKGSFQGLYRILRCNPWGGTGYDPPPGWEEYLAKHPEAAYVGRRPCDLPDQDPRKSETDTD
jgi:putative membrane protein insertion efficiency factor